MNGKVIAPLSPLLLRTRSRMKVSSSTGATTTTGHSTPTCRGIIIPSPLASHSSFVSIKAVLFLLTFFSLHSHHRWTSQALGGKILNEGNSLFHIQWTQGGDWLKWENDKDQSLGDDETLSSSSSSSSSSSHSSSSSSSSTSSSSSSSPLSEGEEWLQILSTDDEVFRCSIPKPRGTPHERSQAYDGPSPLSILNDLFQKGSCSYRIESYWTYEVCHGKYVRQFHESKDTGKQTKLQEYYLGHYDHALQKDVIRTGDGQLPKVPLKKVDDAIVPYFEVVMTEGTPCDLIVGVSRRTSVLYVCHEGGRNEIAHQEETSTCEYTVVIYSAALCSHPYYQREEPAIQTIQCFGKTAGKPQRLIQLEQNHRQWTAASVEAAAAAAEEETIESSKTAEAASTTDEGKGAAAGAGSSTEAEAASSTTSAAPEDATGSSLGVEEPTSPATMPRMMSSQSTIGEITDRQWIDGFLAGENCVQGGTGYWKHELCFRKYARQFHRERDGSQIVISLGVWNEAEHKQWTSRHPTKKVKRALSISNYYSGGDYCEANSRPRTVEVKLKCKSDGDPHSVSIYLLEPETCEYIMGVESPLFCGLLHKASAQGLLPDKIIP